MRARAVVAEHVFDGGDETSFVIVMGSSIVAMFLLQNLASNTVLYMYCKVLHGELAGEIAVVGYNVLSDVNVIFAISCGRVSMALTPWLAVGGQLLASRFELHDVRSLLPVESECLEHAGGLSFDPDIGATDDLQDHIIICGFGHVGQIIVQLLSEQFIPFVALDVRRTVCALSKYFPNVKTFVRVHDVDHGLNLEKAGPTTVVPETLEPSLQLATAVLAQVKNSIGDTELYKIFHCMSYVCCLYLVHTA
ncbi:hypothetical protein HYC85_006187 [Camellia sinensis]|uniref:RCK N-terminal domain-containing protein n=1 Tax=Camellia sinensis TaxID=4442 RepID=A0A7J7HM90_CAMSI|nr:hypothetical protein HYC85_006187 [Camellia sinensis]